MRQRAKESAECCPEGVIKKQGLYRITHEGDCYEALDLRYREKKTGKCFIQPRKGQTGLGEKYAYKWCGIFSRTRVAIIPYRVTRKHQTTHLASVHPQLSNATSLSIEQLLHRLLP